MIRKTETKKVNIMSSRMVVDSERRNNSLQGVCWSRVHHDPRLSLFDAALCCTALMSTKLYGPAPDLH